MLGPDHIQGTLWAFNQSISTFLKEKIYLFIYFYFWLHWSLLLCMGSGGEADPPLLIRETARPHCTVMDARSGEDLETLLNSI